MPQQQLYEGRSYITDDIGGASVEDDSVSGVWWWCSGLQAGRCPGGSLTMAMGEGPPAGKDPRVLATIGRCPEPAAVPHIYAPLSSQSFLIWSYGFELIDRKERGTPSHSVPCVHWIWMGQAARFVFKKLLGKCIGQLDAFYFTVSSF